MEWAAYLYISQKSVRFLFSRSGNHLKIAENLLFCAKSCSPIYLGAAMYMYAAHTSIPQLI